MRRFDENLDRKKFDHVHDIYTKNTQRGKSLQLKLLKKLQRLKKEIKNPNN